MGCWINKWSHMHNGLLTTLKGIKQQCMLAAWCVGCVLSYVWLFATPWTETRQAPLGHEQFQAIILEWVAMPFSRESSWTQGSNPCLLCLPALTGRFFTTEPQWEATSFVGSHKGLGLGMDIHLNHYANWEKTNKEIWTLHDLIYMNYSE